MEGVGYTRVMCVRFKTGVQRLEGASCVAGREIIEGRGAF